MYNDGCVGGGGRMKKRVTAKAQKRRRRNREGFTKKQIADTAKQVENLEILSAEQLRLRAVERARVERDA